MISYIITTYILSLVGCLFYCLLVRNQLRFVQQKAILLFIVGVCLCLPLLPLTNIQLVSLNAEPIAPAPQESALSEPFYIPQSVYEDYCPEESELIVCYEMAMSEEHFCECNAVSIDNLLVYKENQTYNTILNYEPALTKVIWWCICLIFFGLLCKILYLIQLIWRSKRETLHLNNHNYVILYPPHPLSVGSFQLWHGYIIWQNEMYQLSEAEKKAILWHEISHLQQKDTWLKVVLGLVQTIWILNPVFYALSRELDRISEYIADEFAVKQLDDSKAYATLLVKMKRYQNLALVHHFKTSLLQARIQYLLANKTETSRQLFRIPLVSGLVIACLAFTTIYAHPLVQKQVDKLKVYETMIEVKGNSDRSVFCKRCLLKDVEEKCEEENWCAF